MAQSSVEMKIDELKKEILNKAQQLEDIKFLSRRYPNLKVSRDRWGYESYYTSDVNRDVRKYTLKSTGGCCSEAHRYMHPYFVVDVGAKEYVLGTSPQKMFLTPSPNTPWGPSQQEELIESLRAAGFHEEFISEVRLASWFNEDDEEEMDDE